MKPFLIDDHAGAQAALGLRALVGGIEEAIEKILEGILATPAGTLRLLLLAVDNLGGGNIDDCRLVATDDGGKRVRHRHGIGQLEGRGPAGGGRVGGVHVAGNHGADQNADR